ncbi:MAG: hypothetical protein ABMB14_40750 [Myxococcota bacterium]
MISLWIAAVPRAGAQVPADAVTSTTAAEPPAVTGPPPITEAAAPTDGVAAAGLPFIEDDLPRAIAEAKARRLPIFVDAWAPW